MKLRVDIFGVWFLYKGDEVCWLFPWKRKHGRNRNLLDGRLGGSRKYCSLLSGSYFNTLKEMDEFWDEDIYERKI